MANVLTRPPIGSSPANTGPRPSTISSARRRWCGRSPTPSPPIASIRPISSPACAASARPRPPASSPAPSTTNSPARSTRPSIDMPELGVHCQAIMESRHVDVIEMDAASHTGIDDVREIIENARYRPVSARTKVYIIDEVHMLSKAAFNGLLKTLEEPPEHVKFLFATTEIEKVPITVRSRCIRFDLKRIDIRAARPRISTKICRAREREGRAGRAGADRPRRRRLRARLAFAARSGDRAWRAGGRARRRPARHARPFRPRRHRRIVQARHARRDRRGAGDRRSGSIAPAPIPAKCCWSSASSATTSRG